ncbi:UNVERIFIED_CONTAM: Homeobox-leucine zipper protein HAT4 [Sesamum radiatum]|uniref:Homeobox-leucine zipper protein HAT4 n=1 Tax=Sesamum radiatum TaxID=300843 RepID=A0AAW2VIC1_SESRA
MQHHKPSTSDAFQPSAEAKNGVGETAKSEAQTGEVWFQNRRARTKLKQTEVDCEYLRRCCENLTEENRRLQKEVTELRALKLSPQFYMNMSPPTTLTMCPQCERVAVSSSANTSSPIPANATGINRQPVHHQRSMPMSSWAAIIPPQPLESHRPRT